MSSLSPRERDLAKCEDMRIHAERACAFLLAFSRLVVDCDPGLGSDRCHEQGAIRRLALSSADERATKYPLAHGVDHQCADAVRFLSAHMDLDVGEERSHACSHAVATRRSRQSSCFTEALYEPRQGSQAIGNPLACAPTSWPFRWPSLWSEKGKDRMGMHDRCIEPWGRGACSWIRDLTQ